MLSFCYDEQLIPAVGAIRASCTHQGHGCRVAGIQSAAESNTTCQEEFRTTLVLTFWAGNRTAAEGPPGLGAVRHPPWRTSDPQQQQQVTSPQSPEASSPALKTAPDAYSVAVTWPADFSIPVDSGGKPSRNESTAKTAAYGGDLSLCQGAHSSLEQPVLSYLPRISPVWVPAGRLSDPSESSVDVRSSQPALKRRRTVDEDGLQGYHRPPVPLLPFFPLPPLRFFLIGRFEIKHAYCLTEDSID